MSNKKNASIKRGNKINSSIEEEENKIAGLTRLLAKKTSNSSQH